MLSLNNLIKDTKNKVFYISPKLIKYCIFPSKYCDYTQFNSTKIHPHASFNRGVFKEDKNGYIKVNNLNWDRKPGIFFTKLLEFEALKNHYEGKQNWKESKFALRNVNYIKNNNKVRGFTNYKNFLSSREKQIDELIESIIKNGIYPFNTTRGKKLFIDNISVVLNKNNKFYFNNRGHHRLSIAKILNLSQIPVKITVTKSINNLAKILHFKQL